MIIDGHEDLAYNAITFGRNYLQPALVTRQNEKHTSIPERGGECMLGWADWQAAQVAIIFCTLFAMPIQYKGGDWEKVTYRNPREAHQVYQTQLDYYHSLVDTNADKFQLIKDGSAYKELRQHQDSKGQSDSPIGLIILMEGAEGLQSASEMEDWYQQGVRIAGPVWAGTHFCGGMHQAGRFTSEGKKLLEIMASLGMGLDISHMTEESALEALDRYGGVVLASHVTARALMRGRHGERLLTDRTIQALAERDGVIGLMPYNYFLDPEWTKTSRRDTVTLNRYVDHIDHVCQLTGNCQHVAIGTDFDGTIGFPEVPLELNTIADLPKLEKVLLTRGYQQSDIEKIFGLNWNRLIERILPG